MSSRYGRRRFLRAAVAASGGLLAGCTGRDESSRETATRTPRPTTARTTPQLDTPTTATDRATTETTVRNVRFGSPTGEVVATRYGSGSCGVVLVPQINRDRGSWRPYARKLADAGRLALAIDEDPESRAASVIGAVDYLRGEQQVEHVVLVGASSGARAVIQANAQASPGTIAGTVAISPADTGIEGNELQGRTLFVVSKGDDDRFVREARRLAKNAPEPSTLVVYEGSAHGQQLFSSPHGEDLRTRVASLLESACA